MFELAGTHYNKGVFELRLEEKVKGGPLIRFLVGLGPVRGRLIALGFFIFAGLLEANRQPLRFLLDKGYLQSLSQGLVFQKNLTWALMFMGLFLYALVFMFRTASCKLSFDKAEQAMRFEWLPNFAKTGLRSGIVPFKNIKEIRVFRNGIELRIIGSSSLGSSFKFRLLSDEQRIFFPLNLSKITGLTPTGEWSDPDDETVKNSELSSN